MKHTNRVTWLLLAIFFLAQILGLYIVQKNIDVSSYVDNSGVIKKNITYAQTPGLETPQVEDETFSFIPIFIGIIIGTIIGLLFAKYKTFRLWKVWFLLAVTIALYKAFDTFIPSIAAIIFAAIFSYWKIYKPNVYVHNFTEMFIYGGIVALFIAVVNVISAFVLLILIAIYDAYAVWKSKHMITLAKFQMQGAFAGLSIKYNAKTDKIINDIKVESTQVASKTTNKINDNKNKSSKNKKGKVDIPKPPINGQIKTAILGGGDIAFPLIFSAAVLKDLMLGNSAFISFAKVLAIPVFATIGLAYLFYKAEKDKFYPAMPFILAGCLVGYGILFLINLI